MLAKEGSEYIPPSLSDDEVRRFQNIYEHNFWIVISYQDAYQQGIGLIILMQNLHELTKEEKKDWKKISYT